jgi:hypothetical protein
MKALRDLRRFILAKSNAEEQHEIREYVQENLCELARDFCVTTDTVAKALEDVQDDASLAVRMLETIRRSEAKQRDLRKVGRSKAAQASAEALASMARWEGEHVHVDIVSLLSSALTKRTDLLVFTSDQFSSVGIYMAPLFDLAKLKRQDLTAFVDANGLHIRWKTGGLNLRPQLDPSAERIVMALPAKAASVVAA